MSTALIEMGGFVQFIRSGVVIFTMQLVQELRLGVVENDLKTGAERSTTQTGNVPHPADVRLSGQGGAVYSLLDDFIISDTWTASGPPSVCLDQWQPVLRLG